MALSARTIRIFSTVEVLREGQADVRHALAALFKPALSAFDGEIYDPTKLSRAINDQYKLGINRDILEEFVPIFEECKWLTRHDGGSNKVAFVITCPPDLAMDEQSGKFVQGASELAQEFRIFIRGLSPLSQVERTDEELLDAIVDWLMRLDSLTEDEMRSASSVQKIGHKLVYEFTPPAEVPTSDDSFLSARFIKHLFESSSKHVEFLTELAGVGLITEVVRDFYKPNSRVKKTDLIVYLDAPVMLDYLGLSGALEQANIKGILTRFQAIGGSLRIYRQSVTELENALGALLARPIPNRQGATADALRRQEVFEPFVRRMAHNADEYITAAGVAILDQELEQFPNEHKFFDKSAIDDLYSQISWVREDAPRYHDSSITALTMRKRAGARGADVFEVKHLVITRNPFFPVLARRISIARSFIGPKHVGPVMHQRQFATAIWLRAGAGGDNQEIPRRYILASCRRVLTLRKNIVQKVQRLASGLTEQQAEQLELLMTEDRSRQILMDRTLGSAAVIDSSNIKVLIEDMKKAAIAEVHADAEDKIKSVTTNAKSEKAELTRSIRAREGELVQLSGALSVEKGKSRAVLEKAVAFSNERARTRRLLIAVASGAIFIAIEAVTMLTSDFSGLSGIAGVVTILGALLIFHFRAQVTRILLDPRLKQFDERTLRKRLDQVGLDPDEVLAGLFYDNGRFVFK